MNKIKGGLLGGRIVKSFLASLITAYICQFMDWPPLFAVMTSVVSIENTSADSFKKGLIRFPASAIGAGIAMGLEATIGETALSYTLAATLTLIVCTRLKLIDGMVVAILTAVAMLPNTYGAYLDSFFIRLATTFTGITVATLINYFVLPPNYYQKIRANTDKIVKESAGWLKLFFEEELPSKTRLRLAYQAQVKELDGTFKLVNFQRSEWRYHWKGKEKIRLLNHCQRILEQLQTLQHQLADLIYFSCYPSVFTGEAKLIVQTYGRELVGALERGGEPFNQAYRPAFDDLCQLFEAVKGEEVKLSDDNHPHLSLKLKLLYDLFEIHDLVEALKKAYKTNITGEEIRSHDHISISDRSLDR